MKFLLFLPILFNVAFAQESTSISPETKLEIAKLSQEGHAYLRSGNLKSAEIIANQIYEKSEISPESYYFRGGSYYGQREYKKAIQQLEKAISLNPDHDPSLFLLGMIYYKLNIFEKSISYLSKAAEVGSFHPFYHYNLAIVYYASGNFEKSKLESEKTLRLKENYFKARVVLIKSLMKLGKNSEAFTHAKEMVDKKQEYELAFPIYTKLLIEEYANYKEGINILTKKGNLNIEEKRLLAFSYMQEGELQKAINYYKQLRSLERDSEEDSLHLIKCLVLLGKDDEAEKTTALLIKAHSSEKKKYKDYLQETIEKRNIGRWMYQPIP
jgi:tetratricopeptide (TPR) repeat protein